MILDDARGFTMLDTGYWIVNMGYCGEPLKGMSFRGAIATKESDEIASFHSQ
jgi:hypothetical protein